MFKIHTSQNAATLVMIYQSVRSHYPQKFIDTIAKLAMNRGVSIVDAPPFEQGAVNLKLTKEALMPTLDFNTPKKPEVEAAKPAAPAAPAPAPK